MRVAALPLHGNKRRGTVAVLVAASLTVLMSVVAISLDGGVLLAERRHAQAVADSAAMAAACDLYDNYFTNNGTDPSSTAKNSALATASANGYANDGSGSAVTVNIPPLTGPFAGRKGYVEVTVQYNQGRSFSTIFGASNI